MKRHLHNKSHYHLITARMGELVPVGAFEVIAGDTVQIQNMGMIRVSPPVTPVMHPVVVRFLNVFVPNRILDPADGSFSWEDFITGGEDGMYTTPPPATTQTVAKGHVVESMGLTPGSRTYNTFLPKAYAKTWNELFRDQQLQSELDVDNYHGAVEPQKIAWEKDYFTGSRPEPQLGPEVTLGLGSLAPVVSAAVEGEAPGILSSSDGVTRNMHQPGTDVLMDTDVANNFPMFADLSAAGAIDINDLRRALALQRYQEARNLYGARYTEYLRYLGIRPSDGRLQRPEIISHGKSVINFSEVLNTAISTDPTASPLGQLGGHGIAGVRSRRARYFCEEHGHVLSLMSVRPKQMWLQSQHKMWNRTDKESYWQKELQQIGQEEVYTREVYADAADPTTVLGYNDKYASFKRVPSRVSGDFRDTLNSWHLARDLGNEPVLNSDFIECNPSDRIYADTSPDSDKLWCAIRNRVAVRSLLRKGTGSRIL